MPARPTRLLDRPTPLPGAGADALSEVLRTIRLTGALFFRVEAAFPWCASAPAGASLAGHVFPGAEQIVSFHVVTEGSCWVAAEGGPETRLEAGDVVVFPHGDAYALSTRRGAWPPPDLAFFRRMSQGQLPFTIRDGGSGPPRLQVLCGFLSCDAQPFNPLLVTLPRVMVVRRSVDDGSRLRQLTELARSEASQVRAGTACVLSRLSELLFIEAVREHASRVSSTDTGWFAGLRDPGVGRALTLLHQSPGRRWKLERLAREAGLSRTGLVDRFTRLIGEPPIQYLTRWRMQMAAQHLAESDEKVSSVARRVGYDSEAAFSRVFKKWVGVPPGQWRRKTSRSWRRRTSEK